MARRLTTKKIDVFAMHGRTKGGTPNYRKLFDALEDVPKPKRILERGDRLVALPTVRVGAADCYIVAYEGPIGMKPLIFNSRNAQERVEQLLPKEVIATRTHALVDLGSREVFVEFNQHGAKAADIQESIAAALKGHDQFAGLNLEFHPMADKEFMAAVENFERVRVATVKLARPNFDWTDDFNHFTAMAQESEAGIFEISAYAERGGALSKRRGLIDFIRELTTRRLPAVKDAQVIGHRTGDAAETKVSWAHFVLHKRVRVLVDNDGHVLSTEMRGKLLEYAEERRRDKRGKS